MLLEYETYVSLREQILSTRFLDPLDFLFVRHPKFKNEHASINNEIKSLVPTNIDSIVVKNCTRQFIERSPPPSYFLIFFKVSDESGYRGIE